MLRILFNYIIRTLRNSKLDFFLNLFGLSVALLVFTSITLYVNDELSVDKYHPKSEEIFRLTTSIISPNGHETNMALANTAFAHSIMDNCPEIEDILCVSTEGDCKIEYGDIEFDHINIREATPSIFDFFSYPVIQGNIHDFLTTPNTIVLTESLAEKIFQEVPPIGQTLVISKENFIVNGIIEDLPSNTGLQFSALYFSRASSNNDFLDWGDYFVYCRIPEGVSSGMIQKLDEQTNEKYTEILKEVGDIKVSHHFQSLESIHFDNSLIADMPKGNKKMIYLFSFIAFLILIIASINYINLNIAQLQKRQKELLIRKINGCGKNWILIHILSESAINFLLAAILSSVWALVLLSCINQLFNKQFTEYSIINNLLPLMLLSIAFGFISGIYPAYQVVKSNISRKSHFGNFGKTLVIIQNSISIVMLAGVFLVIKQVQYMKNHDLGLEIAKDKIVAIELPFASENFPGTEVIREKLSQLKEVDKIAFGGNGTNLGNKDSWMRAIIAVKDEDGNDVQFVANQPRIDENYIDLFGIEIIKGRNFNRHLKSDEQWGVIINKTYANAMGWQDPIGKSIFEDTQHNVIGVINDFHFDALYNPIEPLAFFMNNVQPTYLFASIQPKDIGLIQTFWEETFKTAPFEFSFVDKHFDTLYRKNEKELTIFSYLTMIAILISCMGLYGLASHFIINKIKEIGIRKVNGAKTKEILIMLNKDFIKWVSIAFTIACPIAWFAMDKWLDNFAYKTELSWWIFALAGIIAMGIALLTVSWQSWRAAKRNPVESLRYE